MRRIRLKAWGAPGIAALVTAGLGLHELGEKSLWSDEGFTAFTISRDWGRMLGTVARDEPNFLLYYSVMKVWSLLGDSEFVLRLISVLCMAGAAALISILGSRLFGTRSGIAAGALFAVNPFVLQFGQEARPYAMVVLLVTGSALLLVYALEHTSREQWAAWGVTALLCVYTHPFGAAAVVAQGIAITLHPRRPPLRTFVVVGTALVIAISPLVALLLRSGLDQLVWLRELLPPPSAGRVYVVIQNLTGSRALVALYCASAVVGGIAILRRPQRRDTRWPLVFSVLLVVCPFGLALLVSIVNPILLTRYLIVVLPGLILMASAGIGQTRSGPALALILGVFAVASWPPLHGWYDSDWKADWRRAGMFLDSRSRPGDLTIVHRLGLRALTYYSPGRAVVRGREVIAARRIQGSPRRVWLVLSSVLPRDPTPSRLDALLEPRFRCRGWTHFNRIDICLYDRKQPAG